jgi:hypothetical protein
MAYILNKTNGSVVAVVQDASLDTTTDLTFLGRNYAGYGEIQNENFLKLLENFSNSTEPPKPIEGQLWYDSTNDRINLYNGNSWKGIANLDVADADPTDTKTYASGDLWYDSINQQIYVYNGNNFVLVGPPSSADLIAAWKGSYEISNSTATQGASIYNIKAVIGSDEQVVAIVSNEEYQVSTSPTSDSYPVAGITNYIKKGITLTGADPETGSTKLSGYRFWGTAAEAIKADTATYAAYSLGFQFTSTQENKLFYVPFVSTSTSSYQGFVDNASNGIYYNPSQHILYATASASLYSDIAERYHADANYGEGTVLVIGGKFDVTISNKEADVCVAGIVSTRPAYRMNDSAGSNDTHPFIALKGRVPCKVTGRIHKGEMLVTSKIAGHGKAFENGDSANAVFAKALESHYSDGQGMIEVMVF